MNESIENCDRKPLIALWYVHKTTQCLTECADDERAGLIRLQSHYLALAKQYGVTSAQIADSLEISQAHAAELLSIGQVIS